MNIVTYILIIAILIGLIRLLFYRPKFTKITDDEIEFTGRFKKIILDKEIINEITISRMQGNLMDYYFDTKKGEFKIDSNEFVESKLYSFAISNNTTLKREEGFHGGSVETIHDPKNE